MSKIYEKNRKASLTAPPTPYGGFRKDFEKE